MSKLNRSDFKIESTFVNDVYKSSSILTKVKYSFLFGLIKFENFENIYANFGRPLNFNKPNTFKSIESAENKIKELIEKSKIVITKTYV